MASRSVVFYGNCQANALANLYREQIAADRDERVTYIDFTRASGEENAKLISADVAIIQKFDSPLAVTPADMKPGSQCRQFPLFNAGFLWPFGSQPHIKNAGFPYLEPGPYPAQVGDRFLNRMIAKDVPREEAHRQYADLDVAKRAGLDRLFELWGAGQRAREATTGIAIAEFIEENFRNYHLFFTPDHPNLHVLHAVARQLFVQLGIPDDDIERAIASERVSSFVRQMTPIHPRIVEHFEMRCVDDNSRYYQLHEGRFTFDEYVDRYLDYRWNPALHQGIHLSETDPEAAIRLLDEGLSRSPQSAFGLLCRSGALSRLGRFEEAELSARAAMRADPDDPESAIELSRVLLRRGDLRRAEEAASLAIALSPVNAWAHRVLAETVYAKGQTDRAVKLAEHAARLKPGDAHVQSFLADQRLRRSDFGGAEQAARKAIELDPAVQGFRVLLADVLNRLGKQEESLAVQRQLLAEGTRDPHLHARLGHILAQRNDLAGAEQAFRQAAEMDPTVHGFRSSLADVLGRQGRQEEALALLRQLIEEGTSDPHIHGGLGHLLVPRGDYAGAERAFRRAAEMDPSVHWFRSVLADVLNRQGRRDEALALLHQLVNEGTSDPHIHAGLGHMLAQANDYTGAEQAFRRAAEMDPKEHGFRGSLADVLNRLGRQQEALSLLRQMVAEGTTNPHVHSGLGHLLAQLGDYSGAEQAFRRAVELDPRQDGFGGALADVLSRMGREDEALSLFHQLVAKGTDDAHIHSGLGHMLARRGDFTGAEQAFRKAAELDPSVQDFRASLADVMRRQGRPQEARATLQVAI